MCTERRINIEVFLSSVFILSAFLFLIFTMHKIYLRVIDNIQMNITNSFNKSYKGILYYL